jgi:hypothetical protein
MATGLCVLYNLKQKRINQKIKDINSCKIHFEQLWQILHQTGCLLHLSINTPHLMVLSVTSEIPR